MLPPAINFQKLFLKYRQLSLIYKKLFQINKTDNQQKMGKTWTIYRKEMSNGFSNIWLMEIETWSTLLITDEMKIKMSMTLFFTHQTDKHKKKFDNVLS